MRRSLVRSPLVAFLLLALASPLTLASVPQPEPAKAPADEGAVAAPEVRLLDAGNAEGAVIRFRPEVGSVQRVAMRMKMDMTMEMNGQEMPGTPMPGIETVMTIKVDEVTPEGDIHYSMGVEGVSLYDTEDANPMMVQALRQSLEEMKKLKGNVVVSNRGVTRSGKFEGGEDNPMIKPMLDNMTQSISQFSAPVPEEAVGAGARWEVKTKPTMNGVSVENTITYTLVERTDEGIRLDVDLAQTAPEQDVESPAAPGAKMHIKSMTSTGKGRLVLNERSIMPRSAEMDTTTDADMKIAMQGQEMDLKQKAKMKMSMSPAKAKAPEAETPR